MIAPPQFPQGASPSPGVSRLSSAPPFALAHNSFPFPALAALAGKAPLGGKREIALACFVVARLATGVLPGEGLSAETRAERAEAARMWLSAHTLPARTESSFLAVADATVSPGSAATAAALSSLLDEVRQHLDPLSVAELSALLKRLGG